MRICASAMIAMIVCGVSLAHENYAQVLDRKVSVNIRNVSLEQALYKLQEISGVKIYFSLETLETGGEDLVSVHVSNETLGNVLNDLLRPRDIRYRVDEERDSIIILKKVAQQSYIEPISKAASASLSTVTLHDERITVTGTVTDATTQQPLAGVSILVKGTTQGTTSDSEGRYSLNAEGSDVLMFSFIGFASQEVAVGFRTKVDVELQPDVQSLKAVEINAGYYNVTEREKTGSISKVSAEVIEKQPVTNPLGALQGRMPGVYIQQESGVPGAEFKIQIRGRNSLRTDGNNPLYIIDGVPFSSEKTFSSGAGASSGFSRTENINESTISPLTSINPADIESIEILKDADATAIYGSRGANGVVLITTKKGKQGKTKFELNAFSGIAVAKTVTLLNTQQYLELRREAFANDNLVPSSVTGDTGYAPDLTLWDSTRYTDWQDVFLDPAQSVSVQASLSGGSEYTQFLLGVGYRNENSVYSKTFGDYGYWKGSFNLSLTHRSASRIFFINAKVSGTRDINRQPQYNLINTARRLAPNAPLLYDQLGNVNWENSTWTNPLGAAQQRYRNKVLFLMGNMILGYEILPGLKAETSFGLTYLHSDELTKVPHTRIDPSRGLTSADTQVNAADGGNQSWIIEPKLTYEKKLSRGRLSFLAGGTFQEQILERRADRYFGFPSNALTENLSAATRVSSYEFVQSLYRYAAAFARLNYNWGEKYIVNLTARRDGSSRFGPARQFANFWAVGAAWIFSKEPFLNDQSFLSFGKLRGSFGATGSDQIGNYQYLDTYATNSNSSYNNQYQGVTWISPTNLHNPNYAWEVNRKLEGAIELTLWRDRVSLAIGYFLNRSSNQLIDFSLPMTTGFNGILSNMPATVQNTGFEIELGSNYKQGLFMWSSSFNLTVPRNKLVSFPDLESSSYANQYAVGYPLSTSRVYESLGVNPETGLYRVRDVNGDGIISRPSDNTLLVFRGQNFYGGINNSLIYKSWSLDVFFQYVRQKGVLAWANGSTRVGGDQNLPKFLLEKKRWQKPGDKSELQRAATSVNAESATTQIQYIGSNEAFGDASFIRLKNVAVAYQIPAHLTNGFSCQLYIQAQNLLLLTNYEGDDPENQSIDFLAPLRVLTAGFRFTL